MIVEIMVTGALQVSTAIVGCTEQNVAMITDPGGNADEILNRLKNHGLELKIIALTHAHVDHIGALNELKQATNAEIYMHKEELNVYKSAKNWAPMFGLNIDQLPEIDNYVDEEDGFEIGTIAVKVLHTPGHTPGGVTYQLKSEEGKDVLIAGDTVFMGSIGRTDFPGGSYETLISSIKNKILTFPDDTIIVPGHPPMTTVGKERTSNPFLI